MDPTQFKTKTALELSVSDVKKQDIYTLVSVIVKVMVCEKPVLIGSKRKQTVIVSDSTDSINVQLWEQHIGLLAEGRSYQLQCFHVREFDCVKYLAMSREASRVVVQKLQKQCNRLLQITLWSLKS